MNKERHHRIATLFDRVVEIADPEQRDEFLAQSCAADVMLVDEVRQLLQSYDSWTAGLNLPSPRALRLGPYECIEQLGRGGMGAVYRARRSDGQYDQEVAVKVLRGSLSSDAYRSRFFTERQILARLNHPNIARLLDGGMTEDGEPFLVMELVDGEPLDAYCDQRKLPIPARLALFHQVLEAVDYAHQNLVVHRDLKPSNIFVSREGVVKLLDFGTSKLLQEDAAATRSAALTPGYASPEQLRGEPVATTSDVFSLGVVLCKLLTGCEPFDASYATSLDRAFHGNSSLRPESLPNPFAAGSRSTSLRQLQKDLQGDLASIINKAMAHDPALRYPSVSSLAADLHRYSSQRPVLARNQNWSYLLSRALRRHTGAVAVAALFATTLAAATVFSVYQARIAAREADRAQAVTTFLGKIFEIPFSDSSARADLKVRELLNLAEMSITTTLGNDPAIEADVTYVLGIAFYNQMDHPRARKMLERAVARAHLAGAIPRQAAAIARLGWISYGFQQFDQAWKEELQALNLWERHKQLFTPRQTVEVLIAAAGQLLFIRPYDAIHRPYLLEAVAVARSYPKQIPPSNLADCLRLLGESYLNVDGRYQDALTVLTEAVALSRSDPTRSDLLSWSLQAFGRANRYLERYADDEKAQREAYELTLRFYGPSHIQTINQRAIWAGGLIGISRLDEAYRESLAALADRRRVMPVRGSPLLWGGLSPAFRAACLTGRFAECETLVREALQTFGSTPDSRDLRFVDAEAFLGISLAGQGRHKEARPLIEQTVKRNDALKRKPTYSAVLDSFRK